MRTPMHRVEAALRRLKEADPYEVELYQAQYEDALFDADTSPAARLIKDAVDLLLWRDVLIRRWRKMVRRNRALEIYQTRNRNRNPEEN